MAFELAVLALGYAWWAFGRMPNAVRTPVRVVAGDGALRLGDETIATSELGDGVVQHAGDALVVRLSRRRALPIELVVSSLDEGRALLRALGKDASQSVVRFRAHSRMLTYTGALFAAFVVTLPILAILSAALKSGLPLISLVAVALVLGLWPSRVDVGPDGIRHSWLCWRTFIPSTRITSVTNASAALVGLEIAHGEGDPHRVFIGEHARDALEERIREIAGQEPAEDAPSVLARGGMDARDWIASLRALTSPTTYRSASVDLESLWSVVESASAKGEDRAAAAIVVARDEETRTRLRVAAEAIAEPKLRVAIEAAADDDAEALEHALDDLREL